MSEKAMDTAVNLLRRLQQGETLGMPISRPMSEAIGPRCHELRIRDRNLYWRIIYRTDNDAILIVHAFPKKTQTTNDRDLDLSRKRLAGYDAARKN
jgi:phage-related protein